MQNGHRLIVPYTPLGTGTRPGAKRDAPGKVRFCEGRTVVKLQPQHGSDPTLAALRCHNLPNRCRQHRCCTAHGALPRSLGSRWQRCRSSGVRSFRAPSRIIGGERLAACRHGFRCRSSQL